MQKKKVNIIKRAHTHQQLVVVAVISQVAEELHQFRPQQQAGIAAQELPGRAGGGRGEGGSVQAPQQVCELLRKKPCLNNASFFFTIIE